MCSLMLLVWPAPSKKEVKREQEMVSAAFYVAPEEVNWAEWHQSFSLDQIYKFEIPTAKTMPALNNDLKLFLLHLKP